MQNIISDFKTVVLLNTYMKKKCIKMLEIYFLYATRYA